MELLSPNELDTGSLFRLVGELIGTTDDFDSRVFRTQSGLKLLAASSSCRAWRLKDSFPMKIISVNEQTVLVEILKDPESNELEERIFPISFFEGYETTPGKFFRLEVLESENSLMFQISPGSKDLEGHFQCFDFGSISKRSVFD